MKNTKKVSIVVDLMVKNVTGNGIPWTNTFQMRPPPGATTVDICAYLKPVLRHKPDVIIVEIPELNSAENKSKRDKLSEHVRLLT